MGTDLLATLQELGHLGIGFVSLTEVLNLTDSIVCGVGEDMFLGKQQVPVDYE